MTVVVTHQKRTQIITIDRPRSRNAVDGPTAESLANAFRSFDQDDQYDVAILTGTQGTFCAGADLKAVATGAGNSVRESGDGPMGPTRMQLRKPVVAAIEGHAVAGGLELALWCDLRVVSEEAKLGVFCRRWGVPLVDGGTIRLARQIGQSRALDLILTGRRGQRSGSTQHRSGQSPRKSVYGFGSFPSIGRRNKRVSSVVHAKRQAKSLRTVESRCG